MKRTKAMNAQMVEARRARKALALAAEAKNVSAILGRVKMAATYLLQAEHKMSKPFSEAELYALLALRVLTTKGEGE